jgi:hypothetical protein
MDTAYSAEEINRYAAESSSGWRTDHPMTATELIAIADERGWCEEFNELFNLLTGIPCIERADGDREWYRDGKLHREDGPAVELADGSREWYRDGKLHREDGPAVERADGDREWYRDGKLHREDGPAVELADGDRWWYRDGKPHREDGPA